MTNLITSEFQLTQLVRDYAAWIISDERDNDPKNWRTNLENVLHEKVAEWVDGSEHVIYYQKALSICTHCDTDRGEQFVEDMGTKYTSIDELAVAIVFGEIEARVLEEVHTQLEAAHDALEAEGAA